MAFGDGVVDAVKDLLGLADKPPELGQEGPTWKDRIGPAAYTPPSGTRFAFVYEAVSRGFTKRTVGFDFPNVEGTYVQQNGNSGRRYPLRCIFSGPDHDIIATRFEAALAEDGVGKLEHPIYGVIPVVPFGDIERFDDMVNEANESKVDVTFFTTTGAVYPSSTGSPKSEIAAQIEKYNSVSAAKFATDRSRLKDSAASRANLMGKVRGTIVKASVTLSKVAAVNTAIISEFRELQSTLNLGLDVLVGQPLQLAQQLINMIEAPAQAIAGIEERLAGYRALADTIFTAPDTAGAFDTSVAERTRQKLIGDFQVDDLVSMTAVVGSVASVVNNTFASKPEALAAAAEVLDQFDDVVAWRDARNEGLDQIDTGEAYQALLDAVALVAGYLIQISSTLVSERRLVLDRNRTILDVCAQLYGTTSNERLDFLVNTNNLSGDELLELKRGRVIRYYP